MERKIQVLFVDDEQMVLDGLRRTLMSLRQKWDMVFANSAQKALEIMETDDIDVIVSDLRMPIMDGATLLGIVKERYPQIVRVILSGQASEAAILKIVNIAHQYLAKPCNESELVSAVDRSSRIRKLLVNEDLILLASGMETIPSVPSLYTKLIEELESPDSSLKEIGQIISQDIGMTAKILKLVNSAFFGLSREITNPAMAVNLLGLNTIMSLVLSIKIFSQFDQSSIEGFSLDQIFDHSLRTAGYAKVIAKVEECDNSIVDEAFVAGILHDCGKLVMIGNAAESYREVEEVAVEHNLTMMYAERQAFKATLAELGAYLLSIWGLPDSIVEATAYHHHPSEYVTEGYYPLTAVHAANAIDLAIQSDQLDSINELLDIKYLEQTGLADRVPFWVEACTSNEHVRKP